jgi:hypothetical protein
LWKGSFERAFDKRARKLQFADGSWWDFLTHDMDLDAFAGADLDRAHFDEEPPGEAAASGMRRRLAAWWIGTGRCGGR